MARRCALPMETSKCMDTKILSEKKTGVRVLAHKPHRKSERGKEAAQLLKPVGFVSRGSNSLFVTDQVFMILTPELLITMALLDYFCLGGLVSSFFLSPLHLLTRLFIVNTQTHTHFSTFPSSPTAISQHPLHVHVELSILGNKTGST